MSRASSLIAGTVLTIGLVLMPGVDTYFGGQQEPSSAASIPDRHAPDEIMARGRIEPQTRVVAVNGPPDGASTIALVDKLLVDQGSKVEAGQVVAILNGFDLSRTDTEVAKASLSLAELQHAQVLAGIGKAADIAAQLNIIAGRRAQLTRLQKDWERVYALVQNQNASVQSLDSQVAQLNQGENDVQQAENALRSLTEVRAVDNAVAEGQIAVAKANVAKAQAATERLQIRAPISGTVLSIQSRAGEAIAMDGILRLADLEHLIVVAEVDESQIGRVTEGMAAKIEGNMLPEPVMASVTRIAKEVFRQKRPTSDILIGRDAKIVEVELTPQSPLPPVVGGEVVVHLTLPLSANNE